MHRVPHQRVEFMIAGCNLVAAGIPLGIPFDPEDAPTLSREIGAVCQSLRCARPPIVYTAELGVRLHVQRALLGLKRAPTLALGWPLLHFLDADEVRALIALALAGQVVSLDVGADDSVDAKASTAVGAPLLARALSRLLAAVQIARSDWWPALWSGADAPTSGVAWRRLRGAIETRGRGGWQPALLEVAAEHPAHARLRALGGATLDGGSHRSAASAWLWEALVERLWTGLESHFATIWPAIEAAQAQACAQLAAPAADAIAAVATVQTPAAGAPDATVVAARLRVRELEAQRRAGTLDDAGLHELAHTVAQVAGARAAHALYRELYARARSPEAALGLAHSLIETDPERARSALERLARIDGPVAALAQDLLEQERGRKSPAQSQMALF